MKTNPIVFYDPKHQRQREAMRRLRQRQKPGLHQAKARRWHKRIPAETPPKPYVQPPLPPREQAWAEFKKGWEINA